MHCSKSVFLYVVSGILAQYSFFIGIPVYAVSKKIKGYNSSLYNYFTLLKRDAKKRSQAHLGSLSYDSSLKKTFEDEKALLKELIIEALASFESKEKSLIRHIPKKHILSGQAVSSDPKNKNLGKKRKKGEKHDAQ